MNVTLKITENAQGEKGVNFEGNNGKSLYFIPIRSLARSLSRFNITPEIIAENVSHQLIYIAHTEWSNYDLSEQLAKVITTYFPGNSIDWPETFWAINVLDTKHKLAEVFVETEGIPTSLFEKIEWKRKFEQFLKENNQPQFRVDNFTKK